MAGRGFRSPGGFRGNFPRPRAELVRPTNGGTMGMQMPMGPNAAVGLPVPGQFPPVPPGPRTSQGRMNYPLNQQTGCAVPEFGNWHQGPQFPIRGMPPIQDNMGPRPQFLPPNPSIGMGRMPNMPQGPQRGNFNGPSPGGPGPMRGPPPNFGPHGQGLLPAPNCPPFPGPPQRPQMQWNQGWDGPNMQGPPSQGCPPFGPQDEKYPSTGYETFSGENFDKSKNWGNVDSKRYQDKPSRQRQKDRWEKEEGRSRSPERKRDRGSDKPRGYRPGQSSERRLDDNRSKKGSRYSPNRGRSRSRSPRRRQRSRDQSRDQTRDKSRDRSNRSDNRQRRQTEKEREDKYSRSNPDRRELSLSPERDSILDTDQNDDVDSLPPEPAWIRCSPADLYFRKQGGKLVSTNKMQELEMKFRSELVERAKKVRASKPPVVKPPRLPPLAVVRTQRHQDDSSSSSEDEYEEGLEKTWMDELNRKKLHPERLHEDLWFNEPDEMNDGPLCRCSTKAKKGGIRHNIYMGEKPFDVCDPQSNNAEKLYHYRISMSPHTNFLTKNPTIIEYDNHEYIFEGFSILSHYKLEQVPVCKVIRFNIEYTIHWFEEDLPENFSVESLDLFTDFLFGEILELYDLDWKPKEGCSRFHLMPRFVRDLPDNGKEILSMNETLRFLLRSSKPVVEESELPRLKAHDQHKWQAIMDILRGMIVTYPGMRPSSLRIDQLDREELTEGALDYPKIIHFGIRPAQLSYAGDPSYQKLWKRYVKQKHLLANKPKITVQDRDDLKKKEDKLQEMRLRGSMKREVTVEISSEGYLRSGIKSDICQHALLLPVLVTHLRFHNSLTVLEEATNYKFKDRMLLQLALTHPSYRVNFGTNPDHARNSLSNCGMRQLEYGDRRIHSVHTRKRGINTLIHIMARMGCKEEAISEIHHYERLEFLGDAVVEFITSIHLFFMFPDLEEGGLATYRAALVQNQHLTVLAKKLELQNYMLYAHGVDLCQDLDLKHAMANCFEALMAALLLDGGIDVADRIFGQALFRDDKTLHSIWQNLPLHPLQEDELHGDRHWIKRSPPLQKLVKFEEETGIKFTHIRILARAFTMRNVGFNHLTFGHNQRLEFLGDTVLQFISSVYLFKHFPDHHEGHLSLLRSALVNNRTQSEVCEDLGITDYVITSEHRSERVVLKTKEKADLVEALLGSLYVDKDVEYCTAFCNVLFFPRLEKFIMNQDWNDPKSQLQQCCLTLRDLEEGDPDIPVYKVLESTGPTNTRKYTVAVYFRGERLSSGIGHSIQQAEMDAAANALKEKEDLFPHLVYQRHFLERKFKKSRDKGDGSSSPGSSNLPSSYQRPSPSKRSTSYPRGYSKDRDSDRDRYGDRKRSHRDRTSDRDKGTDRPRSTGKVVRAKEEKS